MRWLVLMLLFACDPSPAFVRLAEARQLAATVQTELARGADAATRVVLRDVAARAEVLDARTALERDLAKLEALVHTLGYEPELGLLARLHTELTRDGELEGQLLALTGEGSNVAAQELSFHAAHDAVDRFHEAAPDALAAAYALRSMEALEGPHIAEADEAKMDALEARMAQYQAAVEAPNVAARTALDSFLGAHTRILALSRRNTNVHALALAIGDKRAAHEACARTLHELATKLQARTFPATR